MNRDIIDKKVENGIGIMRFLLKVYICSIPVTHIYTRYFNGKSINTPTFVNKILNNKQTNY